MCIPPPCLSTGLRSGLCAAKWGRDLPLLLLLTCTPPPHLPVTGLHWGACATRRRSVATGAPMWVPCRDVSSRVCARRLAVYNPVMLPDEQLHTVFCSLVLAACAHIVCLCRVCARQL
ncbi:hypothetical protein DUNSADRAFT_10273 [Dunaliella salina]|uniref:Secreted protein n=1 Tax=Dunaliella salina TaxID=3046 RepID=A0ABQ7GFP8_DUNSA|nr:hypothetical protein DUNSADRAFT_10273 [Dunaliella salina]|eukprot:KAF5833404.1 hypothetical protein DUNSADRAFT_10273 [Dunaliella salina]